MELTDIPVNAIIFALYFAGYFFAGLIASFIGGFGFISVFLDESGPEVKMRLSLGGAIGLAVFGFLIVELHKEALQDYALENPQDFCDEYCLLDYCEGLFEEWKKEN